VVAFVTFDRQTNVPSYAAGLSCGVCVCVCMCVCVCICVMYGMCVGGENFFWLRL
jgi:hypothetical protein